MKLAGKENNKPYGKRARFNKVVLSFVMGIVLGSVGTWAILGNTALSPTLIFNSSVPLEGSGTKDATSAEYIIVENQLAGDRVLIKEIALSASTWAVVHEDVEGIPGNALGAQRFDKGIHNGTIDLLRSTNFDQNYYVLLYRDDGDREFDLETDSLVVGGDGNPVRDIFQVIRIDRKIN